MIEIARVSVAIMSRAVKERRVRELFIVPSLLLALPSTAAAQGEAPFGPIPNVVDYAATMAVDDSWARVTGSSERTVTHHAAWTRIDEVKHGRPSTTYIGADNVSVYVTRASSGAYASLAIRREAP